jgi:hypothetical protein
MFTQLLDAMLLQEDFAIINQVVLKLKAMAQRGGDGSPVALLLDTFLAKMGEEQRVNRVGEVLRYAKLKNPGDMQRYLGNLPTGAMPMLLDALEVMEQAENRTLVLDALVPNAQENPDPFVNRLRSNRPQTVRDMIYVLDRSNHPDKLKFFGQVLTSKNLAVKLDVMQIIARGRTGEARNLISSMLNDDTMQVRLQAARVLPEFDRERAFLELMKAIKDPTFERKSPEEKEGFYAAIGSTGLPGAIAYFAELLQTKAGLFNKQKIIDDKVLALAGLGGACTIQTAKLLQEVSEDKSQPTEVHNAARRHLLRTRKALFGSADKEA